MCRPPTPCPIASTVIFTHFAPPRNSFDKGELALIASQALNWYDRARVEQHLPTAVVPPKLPTVPQSREAAEECLPAEGGLNIPQQEALQAEVVRLQKRLDSLEGVTSPQRSESAQPTWLPGSTVDFLGEMKIQRRLRESQEKVLESEAKIEHLHKVLSERTRRVIKLEELMRERTRQILALKAQTAELTQAAAMYTSTGETSYVDAVLQRDCLRQELQDIGSSLMVELAEVEAAVEQHLSLWHKVTGADGNVIVMTPRKMTPRQSTPADVATIPAYNSPQAKAAPPSPPGGAPCLSAFDGDGAPAQSWRL